MSKKQKNKSNLDLCEYHMCKKKATLSECQYCHNKFCEEHIRAKLPSVASFKRTTKEESDFISEYDGKNAHPCGAYRVNFNLIKESKEKDYEKALDKALKIQSPIYSKPQKIENEYVKTKVIEPEVNIEYKASNNRKQNLSSKTKHHNFLPKVLESYLVWLLAIFVIFTGINAFAHNSMLELIAWLAFYVVEIVFMTKLIKRVDMIRTDSDLSIWGLKGLSFIFILIGVYILIFGSIIFGSLFNAYVFGAILIPFLGFFTIGAFLVFKFKRRSGSIVYVGRA